MKNKFLKFESSLLAFLFLFSQNTILAEGFLDCLFGNNLQTQVVDDTLHILGEVESKRSEYTKHFRMSDGSMKAIRYSDQVHYKDGECFKEIDNSLISEGNDVYKNTDSPLRVNISKNFKNKNLITLNSDNHEISLSYIKKKYKKFDTEQIERPTDKNVVKDEYVEVCNEDEFSDKEELNDNAQSASSESQQEPQATSSSFAIDTSIPKTLSRKITKALTQANIDVIPEFEQGANSVQIENLKDKTINDGDMKKINANKAYSTAVYPSSDQDIDLRYALSGLMFKENIVLNKKLDDNDKFDFECKTNLSLSKNNNGNLIFSDGSGKTVFIMPKGVMWDANDSTSSDVEYEFTSISGGYIISIVPNRDWIDDVSRAYPITIDPTITTNQSVSSTLQTGIVTTQCSSSHSTTSYAGYVNITVGALSSADQWIGYVKLNDLPKFSHGEMITSAKLCLHPYPGSSNSYVTSPDNTLGLKKITETWSENITWNTKPRTENTIQDYYRSSSSTLNDYNTWNITKIAKDWYALDNPNANDGIELSTTNTGNSSLLRYVSVYDTVNPDKKPYFEFNYREFVGEEEYWSYKSHSAGYKGVGNVNVYAGTLSVAENVLSYSGSRNPLSISNTYNICDCFEKANGYVHDHRFSDGYSHSSYTGLGFRLSFNKLVYPIPSSDPLNIGRNLKYVYVDGDGTQHYFKLDSDTMSDVDGLNLTLTETSSSEIEIKDLKDNKLFFGKLHIDDDAYVLVRESDNEGNMTTYNYGIFSGTAESKIDTITDSAGRITSISYNNDNTVSAITMADGKQIGFSYSDGKLSEITYPGDSEGVTLRTGYGYDEQGRLSKVWTNEGVGRCVQYNYASNDYDSLNFFKIKSVKEYAGTEIDAHKAGKSINFVYEMNETKVTSGINNDNVSYGKETEIWQFDNDGQVTAVVDDNGNMISSMYYKEENGKRYKIKHKNDTGKYTNNLLKNTYANNDLANWIADNWIESASDPSDFVGVDTDFPNLGTKCFKITRSNNSDAPWPILRQRVVISKKPYDRKFTFSGDIKTSQNFAGGTGASLHLASFGANGQQMSGNGYSRWLKSETDWTRENVTINVPAGATEVECAFGVKESIGTAYFDCLQLEESDTPNDYNMVENSSFDNKFEGWTKSQDAATIEDGKLKIIGDTSVTKKVSQEIFINKTDPVLAIRANAQGTSVPNSLEQGTRYCIECTLNFSTGNSRTMNVWFNSDVSGKQSVYKSISSADYGADKTITSIVVSPCFDKNCNTVFFDNIQVSIGDLGITYDLNDEGIITKITYGDGSYEEYTVNNNNETTQIKDARDNQVNFEYNDLLGKPHQSISHTVKHQNVDVNTTFNHDAVGNIISTSTQDANDTESDIIQTEIEYTQSKNYVSKQINSRSKATEFTVIESNGIVTKEKNPNNVETNYVYNGANRLSSETCSGAQTTYSYLNGVLSSISHKVAEGVNTVYSFVKDMFGNISEIKVGDRILSKNTYDAGNGFIRQTKYGNDQTVNYDYDSQGRLIKKSFGYRKGNKFGEIIYSYDNKNRITEIYDSINDLSVKFEYDGLGRLLRTVRSDGIGSDIKYNAFNDLIIESASNIFGIRTSLNNTFGKQDKLLNSEINVDTVKVFSNYNYGNDSLGRLMATESFNSDSTLGLQHEFGYLGVENAQGRTTDIINSVEIKKKVENSWISLGERFNYAYDNVGNITSVTDINNNSIASYVYNDLNELVRENNVQTGKTVAYTYNVGGNITKKKIYSYTTDEDLTNATLESTITYNYSDANWPDKLTSITCGGDEQAIIYDAIGNPLEYRKGWNFSWARGHRLDKMENSGYNIDIAFKYDENGVRTQKTVNGVQTNFITSGIKLLAQKTGENVLLWQVDGNGNTIGFNYNNVPYFYMKNLQGDIIGITDTSGNIVARYTYDSWGKLISIKDASNVDKITDTTFIGYINPLRYRGYYYDSETGFYYLNARYYDPEIGRFINADETLDGGYNLFEYCYNNPVNAFDPEGFSGILQIFAHTNHAWITFTSDQTGVTCSIGTWDGSHGKSRGVNYDVEAAGIANRNWYRGRVSLSAHIDDIQEQNLFDFIQHNNRWEWWYNCSSFASDAWAAAGQVQVSNKMLYFIPTPWTLAESIKQIPGYRIDAPIVPI